MKNKILTPFLLVLSFLIFSLVYAYSVSNLTVISYSLQNSAFINKVYSEFTKDKVISAEFIPRENYLGQIWIRFNTYNRVNRDSLIFRMKEKGSQNWYYEHVYKTDQFLSDYPFTFGFPPIANSKDKTYQVQITSIDGTLDDSVTLSKEEPLATISFQYPKNVLLKNPIQAISFLKDKILLTEINLDWITSFFIYLNFIFLMMFLESIFIKNLLTYKLKNFLIASNVIVVSLIIMLLSAIMYYFKKPELSLNITVLAYFVLAVGVIWLIVKTKNK